MHTHLSHGAADWLLIHMRTHTHAPAVPTLDRGCYQDAVRAAAKALLTAGSHCAQPALMLLLFGWAGCDSRTYDPSSQLVYR